MAVINLRGVPDELAAQLKSEAALGGVGYHEYCVMILEQRMLDGDGKAVHRKKSRKFLLGAGPRKVGATPACRRWVKRRRDLI